MTDKLRVNKIILESEKGTKRVELTIDEAKELFYQLDELFGIKDHPFIPSPAPIIIEKNIWPTTPYVSPYHPFQPYWTTNGTAVGQLSSDSQITYCCNSV